MPESSVSSRPRRRRIIVAVAVLAVLVLAPIAWAVLVAAPAARDQIRVEPRWFRCDGDEIPFTIQNSGDDSGFADPLPAFEVSLEDRELCQLQFTIINDGSHTVHVGDADFPAMTPGRGGFPLEVTENGGTFTDDPEASYSSAATIDIDEELEGGSSIDVLVDMRPRRPYPQIDGVINTISQLPRVHVSRLGVTGTVEGSVAIAATISQPTG